VHRDGSEQGNLMLPPSFQDDPQLRRTGQPQEVDLPEP
jgi:hypothetical protein